MTPNERTQLEALRDRWRAWKVREIGENARDAFLDCADAIDAFLREHEDGPDSSPEQAEAFKRVGFLLSVIRSGEPCTPHVEEAADCLRAYIQRAVPEWRDIESAPRDGTWILLAKIAATEADPEFGLDAKPPWVWWATKGQWSDRWGKWWCGLEPSGLAGPTHWTPLPAAPRAGDKS